MAKGSPLLSSSLVAPPAPYLGSLMRSYSSTGEMVLFYCAINFGKEF